MELQTLGDKALREMAFKHIVQSIKRMNLKHKDEAKNRALQNILFVMLQVFEYLSIIMFCACLV
jgi:protein SDA1